MNAVIYARYSSAGQRDVSIEDQIREITAYADCHNLTITHTYADRKTTGRSTDKRKDFLRMIADSDKHAFQCVLIYKFDRFARNKYDAVIYKKRLKDNGVKVIAVAEPIPDGYGAKILESIYEAMAEEYSENLSQNIKRGQKGNALKCYANHKAPFGYVIDHDTHRYAIDNENAPYVKRIFRMVIEGRQHKEILKYLADNGKPHSKHWLYQVLRNERYTGVYIYGDTRIDGGMPQLISKDDFNAVRSVLKLHQQKPQLKPYNYLFSGLIYCGYCNTLMCGESATSHTGQVYRYYTCPNYKRNKKCQKRRISAEILESKAISSLKSVIFTDDVITRLANDLYSYLNTNRTEYLSTLRKRLADTDKRLANMLSLAETTPHLPATFMQRMTDLENEKNELTETIASEQFAIDSTQIQKDDLIDLIHSFANADNRTLVNTFVTRITLYDTYAILAYDSSGDNTINIPLTDTDFVHDATSLHQRVAGTKVYIHHATLYIYVPLVA